MIYTDNNLCILIPLSFSLCACFCFSVCMLKLNTGPHSDKGHPHPRNTPSPERAFSETTGGGQLWNPLSLVSHWFWEISGSGAFEFGRLWLGVLKSVVIFPADEVAGDHRGPATHWLSSCQFLMVTTSFKALCTLSATTLCPLTTATYQL